MNADDLDVVYEALDQLRYHAAEIVGAVTAARIAHKADEVLKRYDPRVEVGAQAS